MRDKDLKYIAAHSGNTNGGGGGGLFAGVA